MNCAIDRSPSVVGLPRQALTSVADVVFGGLLCGSEAWLNETKEDTRAVVNKQVIVMVCLRHSKSNNKTGLLECKGLVLRLDQENEACETGH